MRLSYLVLIICLVLLSKSVFNVKFMINCMYIILGCDGTRVVYSVFSSNFVSNVLVMCLRSLMG